MQGLSRTRRVVAGILRRLARGLRRLADSASPGASPLDGILLHDSVLDLVGSAVAVTDPEGRIAFANRAVAAVFGWQPDELIGRLLTETFSVPGELADREAQLSRLAAGEALVREGMLRRRDGSEFPALIHIEPRRDATGAVTALVAVAADVTDLKRAEQAARESQDRLEFALTAGHSCAYEWDVDTNVVRRTHQWAAIFGMSEAFLQGTAAEWFAHVEPADQAALREALARLSPAQPTYRLTYRFRRPDGTVSFIEDSARGEFDETGRLRRLTGLNRDVTEQRRAEQAQHDMRELLEFTTAVARCYAYDWDADADVLFRVPQSLAHMGIEETSQPLRGREHLRHIVEEDRAGVMREMAAVTPTRDVYNLAYRYRLPDGRVIRVHDTGRAIFDAQGKLVRVRGMARDTTGAEQAETKLRAAEQSLQLALEAAEGGVWEYDFQHGTASWSDGFYRMLGYAPGGITPSFDAWLARVHPAARESLLGDIQRLVAEGAVDRLDVCTVWPDGSEHWLRYHGRATATDAEGLATRARGVAVDVTDLRRVQDEIHALNADLEQRVHERTAALESANAALRGEAAERQRAQAQIGRLAAVVESTSDLVGVADLRTNQILYVNRALRETTGADPVGRPLEEAFGSTHPPDGARLLRDEGVPAALRDGIWSGSNRVIRADGSEIPVSQVLLAVRDASGEIAQLSTIMRDESARERTAAVLRERAEALAQTNAELARAARMKDEFLANMSHELRTPLNAVLGISEALREEIYGPLEPRQREALGAVEHSGRHLLGLIDDVLDLARLEAGKLTLDVTPVSVRGLCEASVGMVEAAAREKGVAVSLRLEPEPAVLLCDQRRLTQVLVNLLTNAVKFTPAGGGVRLAVRGDRANGVVELAVEDDGIGIAAAEMDRLFKPFSQLDAGLNRQIGGFGLGLSIVRGLVDLHGGSVAVVSEPGRGSRFAVSLPWRAGAVGDAPGPSPRAAIAGLEGAPLVLVVDDDAVNAQLVADFLVARGARTRIAGDGVESLRIAARERPDVVLMDIQMPRMDGLEATRALRAMPACADVPIVAVTALAMAGDRERCLEAGATDYVAKPISLVALLDLIRRLLAHGRAGAGAPSGLPAASRLLDS